MIDQMEAVGFGYCTYTEACITEYPKEIGQPHITRMNREFLGRKFATTNMK